MRVMVTGGGTGGHTSPIVAIIQELQRRDAKLMVQWLGCANSIEERVAEANGIPFRAITASGWPRRNGPRRLWVAMRMGYAYLQSLALIRRFRPQAVIGAGGYVSLPPLMAAQHLGVPTVLHEQNRRLGLANRLSAAKAARILLSFDETEGAYPKARAKVVGNPVRAGFVSPPEQGAARESLGLEASLPAVLIAGGSQGARTLNEAVAGMLPHLEPGECQLIWLCGRTEANRVRELAEQAPAPVRAFGFLEDMPAACAAADLIISRAGASSTAEIAAMGVPAILVPYPYATDLHQHANARSFVEAGAAIMMEDAEVTSETLLAAIRELLADPPRLEAMAAGARSLARPTAAELIGNEIVELVFEGGPRA